MRRFLITLLSCWFALMLHAEHNILYFFMHNGSFSAFYEQEIDSIVYSNITVDSIATDGIVVQEVWTADSVYRMTIAEIDSVSLRKPETKLLDDVVNVTDQLFDYLLGQEGDFCALFRANVPHRLLPEVGEVLYIERIPDIMPEGFAGRVQAISYDADCVRLHCDSVGLDEVFERLVVFGVYQLHNDEDNPNKVHLRECVPVRSSSRRAGDADAGASSQGPGGGGGSSWGDEDDSGAGSSWGDEDGTGEWKPEPVFKTNLKLKLSDEKNNKKSVKVSGSYTPIVKMYYDCKGGDDSHFYQVLELTNELDVGFTFELGREKKNDPLPYTEIDATSGFMKHGVDDDSTFGYDFVNTPPLPVGTTPFSLGIKVGFFFELKGEWNAAISLKLKRSTTYKFTVDDGDNDVDDGDANGTTLAEENTGWQPEFGLEGSIKGSLYGGLKITPYLSGVGKTFSSEIELKLGPSLEGEVKLDLDEGIKDLSVYSALRSSKITFGLKPALSWSFNMKFWGKTWTWTALDFSLKSLIAEQNGYFLPDYSSIEYLRSGKNLIVKYVNNRAVWFCSTGIALYKDGVFEKSIYEYSAFEGAGKHLSYYFKDLDFEHHRYSFIPMAAMFDVFNIECPGADVVTCPDNHHPHLIDLGLPSDTWWSCCNLGAANPFDGGSYYQWGATQPTDNYCEEYQTPNVEASSIKGSQYDAATANLGSSFVTPNANQFVELLNYTYHEHVRDEPANGHYLIGAHGNFIFLPHTGVMIDRELKDENHRSTYLVSDNDSNSGYSSHHIQTHGEPHGDDEEVLLYEYPQYPDYYGTIVRPVDPKFTSYRIQVSPSELQFGRVAVGSKSTQALTVTNIGSEPCSVRPKEQVEGPFSMDAEDVSYTLSPGNSCSFDLVFEPVQVGVYGGEVIIMYGDKSQTVPVSAEAVAPGFLPMFVLSNNTLDFGTISIGSSKTLSVEIHNEGKTAANLTVGQQKDFTFNVGASGVNIGPDQSYTLQVTYTPTYVPDVCPMLVLYSEGFEGGKEYLFTDAIVEDGHGSADTHEYVDLGLPSGTLWATCNVGANSPEEYGGYYAWGETEEKDYYGWHNYNLGGSYMSGFTKYCTNSELGIVDNKTQLEPEDDVAHVKWGDNWRMPTITELEELHTQCTWNWAPRGGVNGCEVKGPNGNTIFIPATGYRDNESRHFAGSLVSFWSSSLDPEPEQSFWAMIYEYYTGHNGINNEFRNTGRMVRPVRTSASPSVPVTSITIKGSSAHIKQGETLQLRAEVKPENATNKGVAWSSDDTSVATVSDDGLVTAVGSGQVIIKATAKDGSGVCDSFGIIIDPSGLYANSMTVTNIYDTRATFTADFGAREGATIEEKGYCYSSVEIQPTVDNATKDVIWTSGSIDFGNSSTVYDLAPDTRYYVCAYVANEQEIVYSEVVEFRTEEAQWIMTYGAEKITASSAFICGKFGTGKIEEFSECGFCYSATENNPMVDNSNLVKMSSYYNRDNEEERQSSTTLTGLSSLTTYYYRAYGISPQGEVHYGKIMKFTTREPYVAPFSVSTDYIDMGAVEFGETSEADFSITNLTDEVITIEDFSGLQSNFGFDWSGGIMMPKEIRNIHIVFDPTSLDNSGFYTVQYNFQIKVEYTPSDQITYLSVYGSVKR